MGRKSFFLIFISILPFLQAISVPFIYEVPIQNPDSNSFNLCVEKCPKYGFQIVPIGVSISVKWCVKWCCRSCQIDSHAKSVSSVAVRYGQHQHVVGVRVEPKPFASSKRCVVYVSCGRPPPRNEYGERQDQHI